MSATHSQIQQFANERTRVRAEQIRALKIALEDDIAAIDDIFQALTDKESPTWADDRTDAPHALTGNDILAMNTLAHNLLDAMNKSEQMPIAAKCCVRPAQMIR